MGTDITDDRTTGAPPRRATGGAAPRIRRVAVGVAACVALLLTGAASCADGPGVPAQGEQGGGSGNGGEQGEEGAPGEGGAGDEIGGGGG